MAFPLFGPKTSKKENKQTKQSKQTQKKVKEKNLILNGLKELLPLRLKALTFKKGIWY